MAIKPNVKYQDQLEAVEKEAKSQRVNLWSN
jgi:endonuclease YncB( thermonuclease family)